AQRRLAAGGEQGEGPESADTADEPSPAARGGAGGRVEAEEDQQAERRRDQPAAGMGQQQRHGDGDEGAEAEGAAARQELEVAARPLPQRRLDAGSASQAAPQEGGEAEKPEAAIAGERVAVDEGAGEVADVGGLRKPEDRLAAAEKDDEAVAGIGGDGDRRSGDRHLGARRVAAVGEGE